MKGAVEGGCGHHTQCGVLYLGYSDVLKFVKPTPIIIDEVATKKTEVKK